MYLLLGQSGEEYAKALSAGLWKLSRPNADNETTSYYTGWITHDDGRVALYVPEDTQPINGGADIEAFMPLVTKEGIPAEELAQFAASPTFSADLRTREQLEADGWFPTEEI
jgi:hypothetical protein